MWIATIAIICQVFYNMEWTLCTVYRGTGLYCHTSRAEFLDRDVRSFNIGALIPALSTTAAAVVVELFIGEVPGEEYNGRCYCRSAFGLVSIPVLVGGKVITHSKSHDTLYLLFRPLPDRRCLFCFS